MKPLLEKSQLSRTEEPKAPAPIVRLEPVGREPVTPVERLVVSVLRAEGAMAFGSLVERVAAELYEEELRHGAWALDIGLFGSSLFVPEVMSEVQARSGMLWRIENPGGQR